MAEDLVKYDAGDLTEGINVFQGNMAPSFILDINTVNLTSGINQGLGPRFAMSPLPGHSDNEVPSGTRLAGIMRSETSFGLGNAGGGAINATRIKIYGIIPITAFGTNAAATALTDAKGTYYLAIIGYVSTGYGLGTKIIDVLPLSTITSSNYIQSLNIYDGLPSPGSELASIGDSGLNIELINGNQTTTQARGNSLTAYLSLGAAFPDAVSFAFASISGSDIAAEWLIGAARTAGSSTQVPKIVFAAIPTFTSGLGTLFGLGGTPPEWNYGNFKSQQRTPNSRILTTDASEFAMLNSVFNATTSNYLPNIRESVNINNVDITAVTSTLIEGTYNKTAQAVLFDDQAALINSSYQAVLVAAGKAFCFLFQDWHRGFFNEMTQYVDLTNNPLEPNSYQTYPISDGTGGLYKEDGRIGNSSFALWPVFVTGTAMVADGKSAVGLGAANSGILRANTVYEFTYSVFDKRLNYETNVGSPVKFQTGATDFVSLVLWDYTTAGVGQLGLLTQACFVLHGLLSILPGPFIGTSNGTPLPNNNNQLFNVNYLQYRFYYRPFGSQEWLPAAQVDAPRWWYEGGAKFYACTGGIGALTGGRPGGFNDYSRLPQDNYNCTLMYKNRAFWLSDKAMVFSLANNIFAYPQRNSVACPTGAFKGAIVQAYYGQAQQDARLVVFSTEGTFVGKFTGNLLEVPVQVSTDTVANFGLDGSDFVIDTWTSVSAFSYRSAAVAEGILYYWGPQGIFRDDGVNPLTRVSPPFEPDIFTLYDPAQTDDIHAVYNDKSKEIWWFYLKPGATTTSALVYNVKDDMYLQASFNGKIDAAQYLNVATGIGTAGNRIVTFARAGTASTIQRAYFMDQRNRAGDIFPGNELMVKTISSPGASNIRRLTLAAGFTSANLAAPFIQVGDYITLAQTAAYAGAGLTTPADFVGKVNAVNQGAGTIDIIMPSNVTFDAAASLAFQQYLPIWHMTNTPSGTSVNAFQYTMGSKYWMPHGPNMSMLWMYLYLRFKTDLLPYIDAPFFTLKYRTPVSTAEISDILKITDNSSGNCQIYHNQRLVGRSIEGQAMKWTLSGFHVGHPWVLQSLEAHGNQQIFNFLKEFEG